MPSGPNYYSPALPPKLRPAEIQRQFLNRKLGGKRR